MTGGAGFIGSCYVRDVLGRRDGTEITVLDKLTYAGNEANLASVRADPEMDARLRFVVGDIADRDVVNDLVRDVDAVLNFAAESHVDRSILDPEAFLVTGVIGVHMLLEACRTAPQRPRYLQVSTDEVYGSVAEGHSREGDVLAPRSPYAAAKASGELLVRSYVVTHGLDAVVTRGSNTYGPYHHPEKLIPLFVTNAIDDLPLPLYGDGLQRRDWLYVSDHASGIDHVLRHGRTGETYNIAGGVEMANRDTVGLLLKHLGKPWSLVRHVEDRPGPRPPLRDGRLQALRARLARADHLRGRPGANDRLVRRQRAVVACRPNRGLGRLLRAPVRAAAADRDLMRVAVTGSTGRLGSALVTALGEAPFTGPARAPRLDPGGTGSRRPRRRGRRARSRQAGGRGARRRLDRRRWLRPRTRPRPASQRRRDRGPRRGVRGPWGRAPDRLDQRGVRRAIATIAWGTRPRIRPRPRTRTVARSSPANGPRPRHSKRRAGPAVSGSRGRPGCSGRRGDDFPHKILDAAAKARADGEPLRVVGDEWGTPTYAADVADAIVELLGADALAGVHHLVNGEVATRATWAEDVLDRLGVRATVEHVPGTTWERASVPPRWGVLAATPLPGGEPMRSWRAAMADYAPVLRRDRERTAATAAATTEARR